MVPNNLIEKEFQRLAEFLKLPDDYFESDSIGEMFQKLRSFCDNREASKSVKTYSMALGQLFRDITNRPDNSYFKINIQDDIAKFIIISLFEASAHRYSGMNSAPLNHHWIPQTYTKGFSPKSNDSRLSFGHFPNGLNPVQGDVSNKNYFVHAQEGRKGFYDDASEKFFSILEGVFSNDKVTIVSSNLTNGERNMKNIRLASFYYVQSVRYPDHNGRFTLSKFEDVINKIFENIYLTPEVYAQTRKAQSLVFIAENPRLRILSDKTVALCFPLSSDLALVISTNSLNPDYAKTLIKRSNIDTLKNSIRKNKTFFGLSNAQNFKNYVLA